MPFAGCHIVRDRPAPGVRAGLWLLVLLLAASAAGCSRSIDPEGPAPLPPPERVHQPLRSTLSVPIEIPIDELNGLVDTVVPQALYSVRDKRLKKGLLRARLNLDLVRNGPVYMRTEGGLVFTSLPLRAEGRVRTFAGLARSFATTFTVHASSALRLDEEWRTRVETSGSFTWSEKPTISLLGFNIDVSETAGRSLTQQLRKLTPRIDRLIEERVDLRKRAERIWTRLADPIALRETPPVWLTVEPTAAFFTPGISRNDTLIFGLTLHAFLETLVGAEPASPVLADLPPLQPLPDSLAGGIFQINLPVSISYAEARNLASQAVVRKDFAVQERVNVRVRDVDLYGHGPRLVARVDFDAGVSETVVGTRGRVFLLGQPVYDAEAQVIRIDSFDYDVHSRLALAEAADLVFREDLLAFTRERLVLPLADRIEQARALLEEALRGRTIGRHIVLDGTVTELVPGDLYLGPDGLHVDVVARGRLTARVRDLDQVRRRRRD